MSTSRHQIETRQLHPLRVTVLRACNLPQLGTLLGKERQFFTTVTDGERTGRSRSVRSVAQCVKWSEAVEAFDVRPLSRITVSLYAKKSIGKDTLVGKQTVVCEPQQELELVFGGTDGDTTLPTNAATLILSIAVSADVASTLHHAEEAIHAINTIKTWSSAVNILQQVMVAVTPIAGLNPYATLAWSFLSKIPEPLLQQIQRDENIETLLETIRDAFEFAEEAGTLRSIKPESRQAKILEEMLECVSESAKFMTSYAQDVKVGKRALKGMVGQTDAKIEQFRTNLVRLRDSFLARAAVTTEVAVLEAELGSMIRELPYKGGWRFGDGKRCLPGTRNDFLDHIVKWIENPKSNHGLVLLGQAGTGKSSIAHEIARRFDDKCLGCYLAFLRKEGSNEEAYQLFTTLARDLSDRHPAFKHALGRVIKDKSSLRGTRDYRTLFELLLLEPLKDLAIPGPILVVVDGLDESGDSMGKVGLHTFLSQRLVDLPSEFRVLITSRPEHGIESAFANASSIDTLYMDDSNLAAKTEEDIRMYIQNVLEPGVFKMYGVELAKASEGVFQWAAVACGFMTGPASLGIGMKKRVQRLLGHSRGRGGEGVLDGLYEEVLNQYFTSIEAQTLFRSIMGQILAAIKPLSIHTLLALRRHTPDDDPDDSDPALILEILHLLGSLLSNVTSSSQSGPIVPLHTSFRDFLTSKTSNVFYIDLAEAHEQLAHSCLDLMLDKLKFNICELESSYLGNSDVPDIEARLAKHVPPALYYACVFWDDHLEHVFFERDLFVKLQSLFETKLLFWLEVLSVTSSLSLALSALSSLKTWLVSGQGKASSTEVQNLLELATDGCSFVRYFGMAMARSAPHIYISALPFAPSSSHIVSRYSHLFPRTLALQRGKLSQWPALQMTIPAHEEPLFAVALSPDGEHVASASEDRTIRVWDATTGELVAGPFTGHTDAVLSVTFSPSGQHIASASRDHTIRVWDAMTGEIVAGPFIGHTDSVNCVAFSPDGERIASASSDCTIRVWDATTGEVVAGPFTGHTHAINSLEVSPDGKWIASASDDKTIRLWDAATGEAVADPFTGHTDNVFSVAISPDGQHIASASGDCTICVWDAETGQMVAGPCIGHGHNVNSVRFSSDGKRITSASEDATICAWDVATGDIKGDPFLGHTLGVISVALSPDDQRIVSASKDHTIRVWDTTTGDLVTGLFTGHTNRVSCVTFSPDGRRIASASLDQSICVWDATTGKVVAFTGHTGWVFSVSFSPNGQRIASGSQDNTIRVWDSTTGEVVAGPFTAAQTPFICVAFSPDGKLIASGSADCMVRVWDGMTGDVVAGPFSGHSNWVCHIEFSSDGQRIASASLDGTCRVWDAATGEVIAGPFTGQVDHVTGCSVSFSPDGRRIASAEGDRTIRVWDVATGNLAAGPFTGHTDVVNFVAFSPDGKHIASASDDRMVRVWDAETGQVVAGPFIGHADSVNYVAFSPDGKRIASAANDCTVRVWDVATGERTVGYSKSIDSIASPFSPDRQPVASASRDPMIHVEKARTGDIEKVDVMNKFSINSDGWMCGEDSELVSWIPHVHRPYFQRADTFWIGGEHETWLDLANFVHGSNWATVYIHDLELE